MKIKTTSYTTHLSERPKSETPTTPNAVEQWELSHSLIVGMQNCPATLEDNLAISYKTNHTLSHDPAIIIFGIYPKCFPGGSVVKNLPAMQETAYNTGDQFDPWVRKFLWRRKWQPTTVFLPGKSHGQMSLAVQFIGSQRARYE